MLPTLLLLRWRSASVFEQIGALLAGSGYGTGTQVPWAVIYTDALAERWSGAPLGIPVHPVQAYAAICFFAITASLLLWLPHRRQNGDLAGLFLMGAGITLFITEFWRDPVGRGAMLGDSEGSSNRRHRFRAPWRIYPSRISIAAALCLHPSPPHHRNLRILK